MDDYEEFDLDDEAGPEWQPDEMSSPTELLTASLDGTSMSLHELREDLDERRKDIYVDRSGEGAASGAALQLTRIDGMDYQIQATIKGYLDGTWSPKVTGSALDVKLAMTDKARDIASFESLTGMSASAFASQIKIPSGVYPSNDKLKQVTAVSMVGKTAGAYLDRGAGGALVGNNMLPDVQATYDEKSKEAFSALGSLSSLYVRDSALAGTTTGTGMTLDGSTTVLSQAERGRRGAAQRAFGEHLINTPLYLKGGGVNKFTGKYEERYVPDEIFALPNELGLAGMKPTMSNRGFLGTGYTRETFAEWATLNNITGGDTDPNRQEFFEKMPSAKVSLIGRAKTNKNYSSEKNAAIKKAYDDKWNSLKWDAWIAREQLLKETVTTQDENWGNASRHTSLSKAYKGDQGDFMNNLNEVAAAGFENETNVDSDLQSDQQKMMTLVMEGASMEEAVESLAGRDLGDSQLMTVPTAREHYLINLEGPEQGTKEWLAQRKGNITASIAGNLLNREGGKDSMDSVVLGLAYDKFNVQGKKDYNHYMAEGNRREAKVLKGFLASEAGSNLTHEEAKFTTNSNYKGFGVSPDGLLFNSDGGSEGLLELKYLSPDRMKGALERYTPQMQMQMAITGETKTHFFAMDSQGDAAPISQIVYADPKMQAQLMEAGAEAIARVGNMTIEEATALEKQVENNVKVPNRATRNDVNTNAKFVETTKSGRVSGAYRPNGSGTGGAETLEEQIRSSELREMERELDVMNQDIADYDNAMAEEADEAARALKSFGDGVKKATSVLTELASVVLAGAETGMDSTMTGAGLEITAAQTAQLEDVLSERYKDVGAARIIKQAGKLQRIANDPAAMSNFAKEANRKIGRSSSKISDLSSDDFIMFDDFDNMNEVGQINLVSERLLGKSPEAQIVLAEAYGFPDLANRNQQQLKGITGEGYDPEAAAKAYEGGKSVTNWMKRTKSDIAGFFGEGGGQAAAGIGIGGAILGSSTVAIGSGFLASKLISSPTARSTLLNVAGKTAGKLARLAKVGSLATLAPMAVRYAAGVEDDGGFGDSMLDIAEMTAWGAGIGTLVPIPGVGTAVGAGVGAAIGVGTELYQWATSDAIPDESIGQVQGVSSSSGTNNINNNNVNVEVNIDPSLITTTVDTNGYIDVDEMNTLSTGG